MGPLPKIPVKVARLLGAVIEFGLNDGDVLVTEGHLLLTNGGVGDGARAQSEGMT
jgi:hypothetical protein